MAERARKRLGRLAQLARPSGIARSGERHHEGVVEFRAFRGTRRSSVYRSHTVDGAVFRRIVDAAAAEGLDEVAQLAPASELDGPAARRIALELTQLRSAALIVDLDGDLAALAAVANWCARARGNAWLTVST